MTRVEWETKRAIERKLRARMDEFTAPRKVAPASGPAEHFTSQQFPLCEKNSFRLVMIRASRSFLTRFFAAVARRLWREPRPGLARWLTISPQFRRLD